MRQIKGETVSSKEGKRFSFEITEELVMNPKFSGYSAGRIELWDSQSESSHPREEYRFMLPSDLIVKFRELFENYSTDLKLKIAMDMFNSLEGENE